MRRRVGAVIIGVAGLLVACSDGPDGPAVEPGPSIELTVPTSPAPATTGSADTPVEPAPTMATPPTQPGPSEPVAVTTETVVSASAPVDVAVRAGDPAWYVVEQGGVVRRVVDGDATVALDITDLTRGQGEQGLLGLTFSQDGSRAYVDYTTRSGGDTVIAEYAVREDGTFDEATARTLLAIDQPYRNHNGGNVTIGPDGYLYIGMGDGGSGNDPERRALNVSQLLGKILRIDPTPSGDQPYTIPASNPFVGVAGARPELWSIGLRNPWRFSFDRDTGDLWIADVGQNAWEEIDVAWVDQGGGAGASFGWSAFEGDARLNRDQPADGHVPPFATYPHGDAGCSISGGVRYRGTAIAGLQGWYVYGDYCAGAVRAVEVLPDRTAGRTVTLVELDAPVAAVRQDADGELVVVRLDGPVERLIPA